MGRQCSEAAPGFAGLMNVAKLPRSNDDRLLVVDDPDGNQLFFNYPNEPA
jgi:hypothetical protein